MEPELCVCLSLSDRLGKRCGAGLVGLLMAERALADRLIARRPRYVFFSPWRPSVFFFFSSDFFFSKEVFETPSSRAVRDDKGSYTPGGSPLDKFAIFLPCTGFRTTV